jgi:hypothetical protein
MKPLFKKLFFLWGWAGLLLVFLESADRFFSTSLGINVVMIFKRVALSAGARGLRCSVLIYWLRSLLWFTLRTRFS